MKGGERFHEKLWNLIEVMPKTHPPTIALAAPSLSLVVFAPRIRWLKRVPGPLVAMVLATGSSN